jgi:hypothetical protein
MWEDPVVSEVRRVREQLAARFNFDVKAIFDDLRSRQSLLGSRLVSRKGNAKATSLGQSAMQDTQSSHSVVR